MTSIITAVFKATIGLLVNKGRDEAAEKRKDGDVADQKFCGLIVREIDDMKSKLVGLSRKDLLATVYFFEAGLRYLYQATDMEADARKDGSREMKLEEESLKDLCSPSSIASHAVVFRGVVLLSSCGEESNTTPLKTTAWEATSSTTAMETAVLAAEMTNMELTDFGLATKKALSQAEMRFKMAHEKATKASNNDALSAFDRVTAVRYCVMATMLESAVEVALETVGTAGELPSLSAKSALENALPECEQCLQKLHSLPDVQNNFKVELEPEESLLNVKSRFSKEEWRKIISAVCQVNRSIYDAAQTVDKDVQVWVWPSVDTGEDKVDPLRDSRVTKVLRKVGTEHCCVAP